MAQHFLLSAKARTLSLESVFRLSDDEAHAAFVAIRFADNGGAAFCPRCQCTAVYTYAARRIWKCKACLHQFSVTSGTIFASRKLAIRDYLAAIAIFVNAVKGISALQLGRDLDVQCKTAFVLAHKLREAVGKEQMEGQLAGEVEVDGAYFGGHPKLQNDEADRPDRRLEIPAKRQSVVVARQRDGKTLPFVVAKEADGVALVRERIAALRVRTSRSTRMIAATWARHSGSAILSAGSNTATLRRSCRLRAVSVLLALPSGCASAQRS